MPSTEHDSDAGGVRSAGEQIITTSSSGSVLNEIINLDLEIQGLVEDFNLMVEVLPKGKKEEEPLKVRLAKLIFTWSDDLRSATTWDSIYKEAVFLEQKIEALKARRELLLQRLNTAEREQYQASFNVRFLQSYVQSKGQLALAKEPGTALEKYQEKWLIDKIDERYEKSKKVLKPLENGDAPFPSKKSVINSVLKCITKEQVKFMMQREADAPFGFRLKPVYKSLNRLRGLVNTQPVPSGLRTVHARNPMKILDELEENLKAYQLESEYNISGYEWEFVQDQQIINPFPGDDLSKTIKERVILFKRHLPKGMRGMDLRTWAILMAEGLRNGKPLDCNFNRSSIHTSLAHHWFFTVLYEEGVFLLNGQTPYLIEGGFNPVLQYAYLSACGADDRRLRARFRASVSGVIAD